MSHDEAPARPARPLVLPEPFTGETDYCDWIDHFENVAAVNGWDDAAKLQWLRVRLTGKAQTALKRLPEDTRRSYANTLAALKRRFEPDSKRELYIAEFQARRKGKSETWVDFAEDLRRLADRAYSDLQEEAKEKLSLNRYLDQIADSQVSFGVKQSHPRNLDDAVAAILELESFKNIRPSGIKVAQVQSDRSPMSTGREEATVGAIGPPESKQSTEELLKAVLQRLERLENNQRLPGDQVNAKKTPAAYGPRRTQPNEGRQNHTPNIPDAQPSTPVVCRKCKKEGHYARGCAAKTSQPQGN